MKVKNKNSKKQVKDLLKKDYKNEVKGSSLKHELSIIFIKKLTLLNKYCKVFHWNEKLSTKKEVIKSQNEIFKREYNQIVTNLTNETLFKNNNALILCLEYYHLSGCSKTCLLLKL